MQSEFFFFLIGIRTVVNSAVYKTLILLVKIGLFLIGTYLSYEHCAAYWYVGPIFGVVVLVWYAQSLCEIARLRCAAFLASSTLIYAFVFWLSDQLSNTNYGLYVAVAAGTILLPIAHKLFLSVSWKRILITMPGPYVLGCMEFIPYQEINF